MKVTIWVCAASEGAMDDQVSEMPHAQAPFRAACVRGNLRARSTSKELCAAEDSVHHS